LLLKSFRCVSGPPDSYFHDETFHCHLVITHVATTNTELSVASHW